MRVSVVVPVYNTGPYIRDLIDSLRAQTLDPAEFEAVFVDDGSTDGTPALLDAAAAETPNFRVIHTPNSGWPGRPRNIGIDAARGDWVFLSDHDDRLDPEALQRLADFGDRHGSDVVLGKIVGVGRSAPVRIFRETVVDAQRDPGLLMDSLTPQKLYRRAFLDAAGIRFPEGRRRLEDHLFVTKAYLRARRVSIYADHPVYYFVIRDDGQNASRTAVQWSGYFANAAESIRIVDAEAPDEASRIAMRRRWLRVEALSRLRGASWLRHGETERDELFAAVHELLAQHYPPDEIDRLAPADRIAGRLALAGRQDLVQAFAEWEATVRVRPRVVAARLDRSAARLEVRIEADRRATSPLPAALTDPSGPAPVVDADALQGLPRGARAEVRLRHAGSAAVVSGDVGQRVEDGVLHAEASLDLAAPELQRLGRWTAGLVLRQAGRTPVDPLTAPTPDMAGHESVRLGGRDLRLDVGGGGRLLLRVETAGPGVRLRRAARGAVRRTGLAPVAGAVLRRLGLRR